MTSAHSHSAVERNVRLAQHRRLTGLLQEALRGRLTKRQVTNRLVTGRRGGQQQQQQLRKAWIWIRILLM